MDILLIEDSEDDSDYINNLLLRLPGQKQKAVVSTTLEDARHELGKTNFSCIILDINLPDSCGLDTLAEVQKCSGHVPIVILTGEEDSELANEAVRKGAQDYLFKNNLNLDVIRRSINYAIERQCTQDQLRHFGAIIECSEDAIVGKNLDGVITSWNRGAKRLYGYEPSEIIGKSISILMPDETNNELAVIMSSIKRGDTLEHYETQRRRKNGELVTVSLTISPIIGPRGEVVGASAIARDITQQKKLEDYLFRSNEELELKVAERTKELISLNNELIAARDQAQESSKLKSEFVANMSHEIRTPMNAIIGMSNVLQKTKLNEQQRSYTEVIQESAHGLLRIINDILDFSRIEAGKLEIEQTEFELLEAVESTCAMLASQAQIKGLSFVTFVDPNLPKLLKGDALRLRQILTNFTANAIKFSASGEVVLRAILKNNGCNCVDITFEVSDSGIGLSEEEQSRLFQPFTQADGSSTRKYGGSGLGLSICKKLVDLMDGEIGVSSQKGKGSKFWCTLPFETCSEITADCKIPELANRRTLIVSDGPQTNEILQAYIRCTGMRVDAAFDSRQGLSKLREAQLESDPFSLVVIDLTADDGGGFILARETLRDPNLCTTKVIMLTKFEHINITIEERDTGISAFFSKPVKQTEFIESVVQIVQNKNLSKSNYEASFDSENVSSPKEFLTDRLVLIAEDNPLNQEVLRLYLEGMGLECKIVNNGREAVDCVGKESFALVLMDCQMPELDGFQATAAIRRSEAFSSTHIPIVAITANAMKGDREMCLSAGMDDYISKPIDPAELTLVLRKWVPQTNLNRSILKTQRCANKVQVEKSTPVDLAQLHARFEHHDVQRLLRLFVDCIPGEMDKLKQAADSGDVLELAKLVHSLRGACGMSCAFGMQSVCRKIEESIEFNQIQTITEMLEELQREFLGVQEFICAAI